MSISSIILAGGLSMRMNGVDKGWVYLQNQPLIAHVIQRLKPQVDEILINANRNLPHYQTLGFSVWPDQTPDFMGPLAGIQVGLHEAKHPYLLTVPCDAPFLPLDLAARLLKALIQQNAQVAIASLGGQLEPVFSLCKTEVLARLNAYLAQGGRKVSTWQQSLNWVSVDFSDQAHAFSNLNTPQEVAQAMGALEQSTHT